MKTEKKEAKQAVDLWPEFIFCLFILYTDEKVIIDNIEEQKSEHRL